MFVTKNPKTPFFFYFLEFYTLKILAFTLVIGGHVFFIFSKKNGEHFGTPTKFNPWRWVLEQKDSHLRNEEWNAWRVTHRIVISSFLKKLNRNGKKIRFCWTQKEQRHRRNDLRKHVNLNSRSSVTPFQWNSSRVKMLYKINGNKNQRKGFFCKNMFRTVRRGRLYALNSILLIFSKGWQGWENIEI